MKNLPRNLKYGDYIFVVWHDAYSHSSGWKDTNDMIKQDACRCYTIGRYIGQNKVGDVVMVGTWDTGATKDLCSVNGVVGRPLAMIQSITKIKGRFPK